MKDKDKGYRYTYDDLPTLFAKVLLIRHAAFDQKRESVHLDVPGLRTGGNRALGMLICSLLHAKNGPSTYVYAGHMSRLTFIKLKTLTDIMNKKLRDAKVSKISDVLKCLCEWGLPTAKEDIDIDCSAINSSTLPPSDRVDIPSDSKQNYIMSYTFALC